MSLRKKIGKYIRDKLGITAIDHTLGGEIDFLSAYINIAAPEVFYPPAEVKVGISKRLMEEYGIDTFAPAIHKNDLMFQHHLYHTSGNIGEAFWHYYRVGAMVAKNLGEVISGQAIPITSLLDFGSGHGRVSRFYGNFLPDAEITVSDVKSGAIQFQQEYLGMKTLLHSTNFEEFKPEKFDAITALSVFTHLPKNLFEGWFGKLAESLGDQGLLIFSFNNIDRIPGGHDGEFHYSSHSEDSYFMVSDRLDDEKEYGLTYVSRGYLERLGKLHGLQPDFSYQGFTGTQEIVVYKK